MTTAAAAEAEGEKRIGPLRIVIVAHGISDQSVLGGPGRVAAAQARALAARGHDVSVVTSDLVAKGRSAPPTFDLLGSGIEVGWVHATTFAWWPGTLGPVVSRSSSALRAAVADADVVHCHEWPHGLVQNGRRAAKRAGVPCVIQPHGSIQVRSGPKGALHALADAFHPLDATDTVVVGSDDEEAEVLQIARRRPVVRRLVNPMPLSPLTKDDEPVRARRRSWPVPADAHVLLFAHRLAPNKGLDLGIEALALLPETYHLVVVGSASSFPAYVKECRLLVERSGLGGRVHFVGSVERTEIDETLLAADTFLLPARRDTFPLMVLHALACGLPAVVTDTCQSVHQLADAVVAVRPTAEAIAAGVASLDDATRRQIAANGHELLVSQFSPDTVAAQLEEIYTTAGRIPQSGA